MKDWLTSLWSLSVRWLTPTSISGRSITYWIWQSAFASLTILEFKTNHENIIKYVDEQELKDAIYFQLKELIEKFPYVDCWHYRQKFFMEWRNIFLHLEVWLSNRTPEVETEAETVERQYKSHFPFLFPGTAIFLFEPLLYWYHSLFQWLCLKGGLRKEVALVFLWRFSCLEVMLKMFNFTHKI